MEFRPPFSHQFVNNNVGRASREFGQLNVHSSTVVGGSGQTWAHVGQDFPIKAETAMLNATYLTRPLGWQVIAVCGFAGYFSAEALAHVLLWEDGAFVAGRRDSLHRSIAPIWWGNNSGVRAENLLIGWSYRRTPGRAAAGHTAFALEAWSGGAGFGSASAVAFGYVIDLHVTQYNSNGIQIGP